jgi:hypothetical protein
MTANIIWNLANNTPGIVGAIGKESSNGTPLRNVQSRLPTRPPVSGPNVKLNPKVNHMTLKSAMPKKICINTDTVFFFVIILLQITQVQESLTIPSLML